MKELKDFIKIYQTLVRGYIEEKTQNEIENNKEDYYIRTDDCGYYNNGVGFACCGGVEDIYDEEKAKKEVIENLDLEDLCYELISKTEFVKAFKDLLEKL